MLQKNQENPAQTIELLNSILDGSTEYAIIVTDLNNKIVLWNKGAEHIYGYSSDEMVGKRTLMELHKKDTIDNDILFLAENTFRSNVLDYKMNAIRKDGSVIPVSVTVTLRVNSANKTIGFLIISRDITKLKLQEQFRDVLLEVVHSVNSSTNIHELCQSVISSISSFLDIPLIYICIFEEDNESFFINSQVGLKRGYCTHTCSFSYDCKDVPIEKKDCYLTFSQLTINSGKVCDHSISSLVENRTIIESDYSIIHIPLLSDIALIGILHVGIPTSRKDFLLTESQVLSLIANEISAGIQRKRLEEEIKLYADNLEKMVKERTDELRKKDAQLIQSGKLATLGEMATGIAHEINQPLGGISLMTQGLLMAKARGKLNETLLNEKLNSMVEQIDRINKIINHLRTFARQSEETKQEIDINNPLTDVFKLIGRQLENRNISIELELTDNLPPVMADHNKLEQVFLNIIGNARDALDDFETEVSKLRGSENAPEWSSYWYKKLHIKSYRENNQIVVEIADNAGGISKSILAKVFEPFFTTKEVGKGTGLGLSITYGIIKDFGGTIEVESEEMKGSKFIVKLPAYIKP